MPFDAWQLSDSPPEVCFAAEPEAEGEEEDEASAALASSLAICAGSLVRAGSGRVDVASSHVRGGQGALTGLENGSACDRPGVEAAEGGQEVTC